MRFFSEKIGGYKKRVVYEWSQWKSKIESKRCKTAFQAWIGRLNASPPDIMVGANFASFGGVRGHIQSIERYSRFNVQLAPPEDLVKRFGLNIFADTFRNEFFDFPGKKVEVAHSHVYPWFIDWCRHHQQTAGLRWVHTYHLNYYPEHGSDGVLEPWQKDINDALIDRARFADVCLSVSKWQVDELRQRHGIEACYLPNGVDVPACDQGNAQRFKQKHRLEAFILYVGRNDPVKNPSEFVQLARRFPELSFVMIGGGLSHQTLTNSEKEVLPKNLRVLGGLSPAEVQDAIAASSLLVVTSKREGLPTLILEAMAHQKPVLVPDEAGCLEAIGQGEFGSIYRPGDIDDLACKTIKAIDDRSQNYEARQHVLQEYDWRIVSQSLDRVYSELISPA